MKTLNKLFIAASLCLVTAVPAYADHPYRDDDLRERMHQLEMRIERGVDRHELSRRQAKELNQEYRRIRYMAKEFREDGHLSRRERHRLDHAMDQLNDQIKWYQRDHRERHHESKYPYGYDRHDDRSEHEPYHR